MNSPTRLKAAPYPRNVAEFEDLDLLIGRSVLNGYRGKPFLADESAIVVTQGSCFARNIAHSLCRMGQKVAHLNVNEFVNTTFANAFFFEYALNRANCPAKAAAKIEAVIADKIPDSELVRFKETVRGCVAFILTIGVAPVWISRGTGEMVLSPDKHRIDEFQMITTNVADNRKNIKHIVRLIRAVAPEAEIFLTLSPTPLNCSLEMPSTVVADCVSKSTLRVAIHEALRDCGAGVQYWPSFEIVRWIGSHLRPVFGDEDDHPRHVSDWIVDHITRAFIRAHGGEIGRIGAHSVAAFDSGAPFELAINY